MMKRILSIFLIVSSALLSVEITPSEVYREAVKIEKEIDIIKNHFNIKEKLKPKTIKAKLYPRHSFQFGYILLARINDYREEVDLSITIEADIAPAESLNPNDVYDQTQRILLELRVLKKRMGINKKIKYVQKFRNKTPADVSNKLLESIYSINSLIGERINPNHVFAQVIRLKEDIDLILQALNIRDTSVPPEKNPGATPKDAFKAVEKLIDRINEIQKNIGIKRVSLEPFKPKGEVIPLNVYIGLNIAISELRTIKAYLEMYNSITPSSKRYKNKTPADVENVAGWCRNQLMLVRSLNTLGAVK